MKHRNPHKPLKSKLILLLCILIFDKKWRGVCWQNKSESTSWEFIAPQQKCVRSGDAGMSKKALEIMIGVANSPSKTHGSCKIFWQISPVLQSLFLVVICVPQSWFFHKAGLGVSRLRKSRFICLIVFINEDCTSNACI